MARSKLWDLVPDDDDDGPATPNPTSPAPSAQEQSGRNRSSSRCSTVTVDRRSSQQDRGGRGSNLGCAPPDRQCAFHKLASTAPDQRCNRYTRRIEHNVFDKFCDMHADDLETRKRMTLVRAAGAAAVNKARAAEKHKPDTLQTILGGRLATQDEVQTARLAVLAAVEVGALAAPSAQVILGGLKDVSVHIEKHGATSGLEGGHSYMRLLPGMDLVEYEDPLDAVLSAEDVDRIDAGIQADTAAERAVPADFADCIERYLGRKARRREKSRFDRSVG